MKRRYREQFPYLIILSVKYWKLNSLQYTHGKSEKNNILKLEDFRRDTLEDRNF